MNQNNYLTSHELVHELLHIQDLCIKRDNNVYEEINAIKGMYDLSPDIHHEETKNQMEKLYEFTNNNAPFEFISGMCGTIIQTIMTPVRYIPEPALSITTFPRSKQLCMTSSIDNSSDPTGDALLQILNITLRLIKLDCQRNNKDIKEVLNEFWNEYSSTPEDPVDMYCFFK